MSEPLSIEAATARILAAVEPLPTETLELEGAVLRCLATKITAPRTLPPFASSAMDGYAVRAADLPGTLRVAYEIPAGHAAPRPILSGEAARIFTGAMLPAGADAVVMQEETRVTGSTVAIERAIAPGEHVRPPGQDVAVGACALPAGTRLGPAELGLLASLGVTHVEVHRAPRVTLLATGDELVPLGQEPGPGQIIEANGVILAALATRAGARARRAPITPDTAEATAAALAEAARTSDLVVSCGGVSVGDYDFVQQVLAERGQLDFWKIAMKPGKPLAFGRFAGTPLLGLPGNPVSAFVTFVLFGLPLLRRMAGEPAPEPLRRRVRLQRPVRPNKQRRELVRARLQGDLAAPLPQQDSHLLMSLVGADLLLDVPPGVEILKEGHELEAIVL